MKRMKKGLAWILLTGVFVLALHINGYPVIFNGKAGVAYNELAAKQSDGSDSMEGLIMAASGYFFKAGLESNNY